MSQGPRSRPSIDGDHLILLVDDGTSQRIALSDIVLIGEHTNVGGPYVEDYWLTLALRDGQTREIGSEDPSSEWLYSALGIALTGAAFDHGLCNQTPFASRSLWPVEHAGAPMLESAEVCSDTAPAWSNVARKVLTDRGYAR